MIQHPKILFNGGLADESTPRRWPTSDQLLEMEGLFETIKVTQGRPVFFAAHYHRLLTSCRALYLPWSRSAEELRDDCDRLLTANACDEGSLKVVVFREPQEGSGELIFSRDPTYSPKDYRRGFRLQVQADPQRAVEPAHKSTKYLKNLHARGAARAAGFDDALFLDRQENVLEGAATNFFMVRKGQLFTPRLVSGILPGIARGEILRRWEDSVVEQEISRESVESADEVFVTNALLGVMPVVAIDQRMYRIDDYVVTSRLAAAFAAWQAESIAGSNGPTASV